MVGQGHSSVHTVADFFGKEVRDCSKLSTLLVMELKKNGPRRRQTGGLVTDQPLDCHRRRPVKEEDNSIYYLDSIVV